MLRYTVHSFLGVGSNDETLYVIEDQQYHKMIFESFSKDEITDFLKDLDVYHGLLEHGTALSH